MKDNTQIRQLTQETLNQELIEASKIGCLDEVKILVKKGADVNQNGCEPLRVAYENENFHVASFLKEVGAVENSITEEARQTALKRCYPTNRRKVCGTSDYV